MRVMLDFTPQSRLARFVAVMADRIVKSAEGSRIPGMTNISGNFAMPSAICVTAAPAGPGAAGLQAAVGDARRRPGGDPRRALPVPGAARAVRGAALPIRPGWIR